MEEKIVLGEIVIGINDGVPEYAVLSMLPGEWVNVELDSAK